ncbi:MAG: undecaprenyl-diphosphate phosphatase [Eubacterium sp.]|nr:undecaprenyl-diphosphate phosphatase [Eubacterium sp.]
MGGFDILVAAVLGIVEGITEWLPVSSTGHMILVNQFMAFSDKEFQDIFLVVVQLGAIMAVVILFWSKLWPFTFGAAKNREPFIKWESMQLWFKIIVSCVPAVIVGLLLDDIVDELFYNAIVVAGALIIYGILFIIVEIWNKGKNPVIDKVTEIGYNSAIIIGLFQVLAAVVPGTSRSGATIIGALLLGISRGAAAEFTFFLAVPVMFGASLLKIVKHGLNFSAFEYITLATGMVVAFVVSLFVIKFFLAYIRKHDFKVFGVYRIVLGIAILLYFMISGAAVA